MSDTAWISRAPGDSRPIKPFRSDVTNTDEERSIGRDERNRRGGPLPTEFFPKESRATWRGDEAVRMGQQPDLFQSGFRCVSAACAAVVREHDPGRGGLHPVRLSQEDRRTQVEGKCFCLNFGGTKSA